MIQTIDDWPEANGRQALKAYFRDVSKHLAPLPRREARRERQELEAHVLQALEDMGDVPAVLARFGPPESFVTDLVQDRLAQRRAACAARPAWIKGAQSAGRYLIGTLRIALLGIGYTLATFLLITGVLRFFLPEVGIFVDPEGVYYLGNAPQYKPEAELRDLLGWVYAPLATGLGLGLVWILMAVVTPLGRRKAA